MVSADAMAVQIENLKGEVTRLSAEKASSEALGVLSKEVQSLADDFKGVQRALIGFALTIAASAVGIAFTIIQVGH